jgi:hypothetical protein
MRKTFMNARLPRYLIGGGSLARLIVCMNLSENHDSPDEQQRKHEAQRLGKQKREEDEKKQGDDHLYISFAFNGTCLVICRAHSQRMPIFRFPISVLILLDA